MDNDTIVDDKTAAAHALLLIRSMGPVTFSQIQRELEVQTPGVTEKSSHSVTVKAIASIKGEISIDDAIGRGTYYDVKA